MNGFILGQLSFIKSFLRLQLAFIDRDQIVIDVPTVFIHDPLLFFFLSLLDLLLHGSLVDSEGTLQGHIQSILLHQLACCNESFFRDTGHVDIRE